MVCGWEGLIGVPVACGPIRVGDECDRRTRRGIDRAGDCGLFPWLPQSTHSRTSSSLVPAALLTDNYLESLLLPPGLLLHTVSVLSSWISTERCLYFIILQP